MGSPKKFYIVRLREDDRIVTCGSKDECAAAMKMSPNTFLSTVSLCRKGVNKKYEIDVELMNDGEQYA